MRREILVFGIILLFVGLAVSPSIYAENNTEISMPIPKILMMDENFTVWINGTMGDNGWFVSDVTINVVFHIPILSYYYSFDGVTFELYTEPFIVSSEGYYEFYFYYIDIEGNISEIFGPYEFKIDKYGPFIETLEVEQIEVDKYKLIIDALDEPSGIARVEFFINEELYETVFDYPWECIYYGVIPQRIDAVAFDYAGNFNTESQHSERPIIHERILGILHNKEIFEDYMIINISGLIIHRTLPFIRYKNNYQIALPLEYEGYMGEKFIFAKFTY